MKGKFVILKIWNNLIDTTYKIKFVIDEVIKKLKSILIEL